MKAKKMRALTREMKEKTGGMILADDQFVAFHPMTDVLLVPLDPASVEEMFLNAVNALDAVAEKEKRGNYFHIENARIVLASLGFSHPRLGITTPPQRKQPLGTKRTEK